MRGLWHKKLLVVGMLGIVILALTFISVKVTMAEDGIVLSIIYGIDKCTVLDLDGYAIEEVDATRTKLIIASENSNKNATFSCEIKGFIEDPAERPSSTVTIKAGDPYYPDSDIGCYVVYGTYYNFTNDDWHQTINPNGDLKLTCQFNNKS